MPTMLLADVKAAQVPTVLEDPTYLSGCRSSVEPCLQAAFILQGTPSWKDVDAPLQLTLNLIAGALDL